MSHEAKFAQLHDGPMSSGLLVTLAVKQISRGLHGHEISPSI